VSNESINQALRSAVRRGRFEINTPIPAENREFNYQIREKLGKPSGRPAPEPTPSEPGAQPDADGDPDAGQPITSTFDWGGGPRGTPAGPTGPSINDGIQEAFRRLRSGDGGRSADLAFVMDDMTPHSRY